MADEAASDVGNQGALERQARLSLGALFVWGVAACAAVVASLLASGVGPISGAYLNPHRCNEALWGTLACLAVLVAPALVHGRDPLAGGWKSALTRAAGHSLALAAMAMPFGLIATRYFPLPQYAYLSCLAFHAALLWASLMLYACFPRAYLAVACSIAGGMPLAAYLLKEFAALCIRDIGAAEALAIGRATDWLIGYSPVSGAVWPLQPAVAGQPHGALLGPPLAYLLIGACLIGPLILAHRSHFSRGAAGAPNSISQEG